MFSRRVFMKLIGAAAVTPAAVAVSPAARPVYDPIKEVVWHRGIPIAEVERLSNYGQRMWIDWSRNAVPIESFEGNDG